MSGSSTEALAPLRHSDFRWLLLGRLTSALGGAVAPVALAFAVLDLTGSVSDLGLVVGARSAANVLLLLAGGVLADRLPRALLLWASSAAAAVTQAAVAVALLTDRASIGLLVVLSVINGAVSALALPASSALTPQTVPEPLLRQANALLRLGMNTSIIGGAALGGILVAAVGPGWGIAVDAVTFAVAAAAFASIRVARRPQAAGARSRPLADLREGWGEFRSRTWVWVVVLQFMVVNAALVGAVAVLGPAIADETFGRRLWGLLLAAETVGFVVGGLITLRWQPRHALRWSVLGIAVTAVPLLALAHQPQALVVGAAMFVSGIAIEQFAVAWDVSLQQQIPPDRLARVYSYDMVGSFVAIPVGQTLIGPLALAIGRTRTLELAAGAVVLATLAALASSGVRTLTSVRSAAPQPVQPDHREHEGNEQVAASVQRPDGRVGEVG
ncbi:MAG TPA: MFS transporter [Actinomycetales bacterium]|jgi:predicted MFS family arabinose efflux permease